ncbi:hypothetical protein [Kaarinaea lacus]
MHKPADNHVASRGKLLPATSFSQLAKNALWGFCLNIKEHVIATHQELAILRRCATLACDKPNQVIHVVSGDRTKHTKFIVNTLMHFGVSCGQINVRSGLQNEAAPDGIWLFVENRQSAC